MKNKARVIKAHQSEVLIPFIAERGDVVIGKEKPTKWKGWLYCKNKDGIFGWVPKAFVTLLDGSSEKFTFKRNYNSNELSVSIGENVKIHEIESGWAIVENENGMIGWIPLENIEVTGSGSKLEKT